MNEFFKKIFGTSTGSVEITLFSIWHILWIVLILGLSFGAYFLLRKKSEKNKSHSVKHFGLFDNWYIYFGFLHYAIFTREN